MNDMVIQLLKEFEKSKKPMRSSELAEVFGVSESKLKGIVKTVNRDLVKHGAKIIGKTGSGNGYTLQISNPTLYKKYLQEVLPAQVKEEMQYFTNQETRVNYIIQRLLQANDYIKADDLCEEINVSRSQLSKDLKQVRVKVAKVGINIEHKPYYGLHIQADELAVRQCLAAMENQSMYTSNISTTYSTDDAKTNRILAQIKAIIIEECENFDYILTDMTCQNLVTHLYVAIHRAIRDFEVTFTDTEKAKIEEHHEFPLAKKIVEKIESVTNVHLSENEIYYCTIHLSSKKTLTQEYMISDGVRVLVKDMLQYVKKVCNIDVTNDLYLEIRLCLHMVPLLSRIEYHLELKNPLLEEIKTRYILAYDIATICADYLNQKYHCVLSNHETSYFALHIQLALSERNEFQKKKVLIVCSTGRGSAELLKVRFQKEYGKYAECIETCDFLQIQEMDINQYDYIFSTIPLPDLSKPVIRISHFITQEDNKNITKVLQHNDFEDFIRYFEKNLFVANLKADNKEDVIKELVNTIKKHRTIPDGFYDSVIEREKMADTCFANDVAMPHPYRVQTKDSFISVGILHHRIPWNDEQEVKIVFLCSFASSFARKNEHFFPILSEVIASKNVVRDLSNAEDYETFVNIIKDSMED